MTITTTVEMFYIGNFADMDTDESDSDNENPNVVLGTHDTLVITEVTEVDVDDDNIIFDDEAGTGDYLSYDTGSGATNADLDSSSLYNADILLGDGTTMSVPVLVIQAANGDVFVSEHPASPLDGLSIQSITLTSLDTSQASGINAGASDVENASVVCYAPNTLIDTPSGPRAVETLLAGDLVTARDHGPQPILWTRSSVNLLEDAPIETKPVQIKAGALGHNVPSRDLLVSPQHRILLGGAKQFQGFCASEVFAPAKSLTGLPGIRHMKGKSRITWTHFACAQHEIVTANGCLSESLLLGPMVINGMTSPERRVLASIFGMAPRPGAALNGPPARKCLSVGAVKRQIAGNLKAKARGSANETQRPMCDIRPNKTDTEWMHAAASLADANKMASGVIRP